MAKKPGAGGIVLLAVILGLVTAYFIWRYLSEVRESAKENWMPVVVAVQDIKSRASITRDMITLTSFPKDLIAADTVEKIDEVEGKVALGRIKAKEQIRRSDLAQQGQMPGLAYQVPPGKRAISIAANEVMSVGTAIKPGDHVDILATYHDPVTRQETTQMILQNVTVLAVNQGDTEGKGEGAKSSMTLVVSPEEAELLTAADRSGVLRVSLRALQDDKIVPSSGVTVRDIKGDGRLTFEPATQSSKAESTPVIISPASTRGGRDVKIFRGVTEQIVPAE